MFNTAAMLEGVSTDTPWLTPEQLGAWMHLSGVLMTLPAAIDAGLKRDAGVNFFEYSILAGLSRSRDRSMQMSELAVLAYGSQSRLSHAVSRLERQGWIERRASDCDVRTVRAILTDAGYEHLQAVAPAHVAEARRLVIDVLTPEELEQLGAISRRLLEVTTPGATCQIDQAIPAA
jgi:DNA-binding MarR family transcriptional regulator